MHQILKLKCFLSRLVVVLLNPLNPGVKSNVENEDVVGAAPTGDAPITPEWSTKCIAY